MLEFIWGKVKEIYEGVRRSAWMLLPISAFLVFVRWLFTEWLPGRAKSQIQWLLDYLPTVNIDVSAVNVAWDRINQWVPVTEAIYFGGLYLILAGMISFLKWLKKLLPFS